MTAVALMTAFASYAQDKPVSWINNVKLSGYGIVQYQSSSKVNDKSNSFSLRLARVCLDGRILDDFYWKAQIQFNGNTTDLGNSPRDARDFLAKSFLTSFLHRSGNSLS